jgi:DNA polymerase
MAQTMAGIDVTKDDPEWIEQENPYSGQLEKVSGYGSTSKAIVAGYRADNPLIVEMWNKLDAGFKSSIGGDFSMKLPSGRTMTYKGVRCEVRIEVDPKTKKPRRKNVFTADIGGRRFPNYGGKLTENAVQATARDIFAGHLLALEDAGHTVLFSCHDEAILEVEPGVSAADIEKIMSIAPAWLPGCPVSAEAKIVECYCK